MKGIIRQPRPGEDKRLFNLKLMSKNKVNRIGHDIFGMPSGHAQLTFYVSSFIFFTLKDKWIPMMYFIVSLITLYQRVKYKNHTFEQVVIGAIVGIIMGYAFSLYNKRVLSGEPSAKKDDNYFGFL